MATKITIRGRVLELSDDQEEALETILEHFKKHKEATLAGAAGCGKCLTGDAYISAGGGVRTILDCATETKVMPSVDGDTLAVLPEAPAQWLDMGSSPVIQVETETGIRLTGTPEHMLLTWRGTPLWKRMDALQPSDVILLLPGHALQGGVATFQHPDEAYLYGMLMGDGNLLHDRLLFSRGGNYLPNVYFSLMDRFFPGHPSIKTYPDKRSKAVNHHLNGVSFCASLRLRAWSFPTARFKEVPKWLMSGTVSERVCFLQGLFDTDGHASKEAVELVSASEKLARQVQQMLIGLGVVPSLTSKRVKGYDHDYWRVFIRGDATVTFEKVVGFKYEGSKVTALSMLTAKNRNPNTGVYPHCGKHLEALRLESPPRSQLRTSRYINGERNPSKNMLSVYKNSKMSQAEELMALCQFFPDSVRNTKLLPEQRVYDFHVPGTHSFISNSIVSHNTSVTNAIIDKWDRGNVILLAPTGVSTKRLAEQTGQYAQTIHSAIFMAPTDSEEGLTLQELALAKAQKRGTKNTLEFGEAHTPEQCGPGTLVIVDEGSFVDEVLATKLRQVILSVGAYLLSIGDHEQLGPVEGVWGFPLRNATATLTKVHRQALGSATLDLATCIREERVSQFSRWNQGEVSRISGATLEQAVAWVEEGYESKLLMQFASAEERAEMKNATRILLTWTNAVRTRVNGMVRASRGYAPDHVHKGETLMCTFNNHSIGLMNGESIEVSKTEVCEPLSKCLDAVVEWVWEADPENGQRPRKFLVLPQAFDRTHPQLSDRALFREAWRGLWAKRNPDDPATQESSGQLMQRMRWSWEDLEKWREAAKAHSIQATWGYCRTVHKSQSAQWSGVGFISCPAFRNSSQLTTEERKRLQYTAVSRAESEFAAFILNSNTLSTGGF
jgi:hypothetical protein